MILLLVGVATVGFVHSLLPDHWVPLAVVARTRRWSLFRVARVSTLAASGHVLASIVLGGVVAVVGLQFQKQIETQQGHIVGAVLVITGVGFLVWGLTGRRSAPRPAQGAYVQAQASRIAEHSDEASWLRRLGAVAVPFGATASPDLTFLPFAFAASSYGAASVAGVLGVFAAVTMLTFVGLTVIATAAGYQMQGEWLEKNANTITSLVLIGIGVVAFFGI